MPEQDYSAVLVPDELEGIAFDPKVPPEKPFNACFECKYFRTEGSGPNLHAMTVERVCEFLQLSRLQLHLTYQQVADKSGLSLATVKRQLTNNVKDPSFLTLQALTFALACEPTKKHPCAMYLITNEEENEVARVNAELARANLQIADDRNKIGFLMEQVKLKQAQMVSKDAQLVEKDKIITEDYRFFRRKNRVIVILAVLLGISLAVIILALVIDSINQSVGFFWVNRLSSIIGDGTKTTLPTFTGI